MGRHTAEKMTKEQALAIMAYDIADMIGRADNYDGLIPEDKLTQDDLIKLLPDLFRAAGFDPFKTATKTAETTPEQRVEHTCNPNRPGRPLPYGRNNPAICERCRELVNGAPRREAPAWVARSQHRRTQEETSRRHLDAHLDSPSHRNNTCNGGLPCTYGQW
jgi:hypothetical protein